MLFNSKNNKYIPFKNIIFRKCEQIKKNIDKCNMSDE